MCTSPILIRNKRLRSLSVKVRNTFIEVPCGCCEECLRKRAKDLFVRARFEAEHTIMNGGCGFMCTLTYDNSNVPVLYDCGKKYMVFDKKAVILFLKRLRTTLDRYFNKYYGVDCPNFKYLVTSEYGTDPTRTHRPHYHLIILFERSVSLNSFRFCFKKSLVNSSTGKSYFGRIFQCDLLDIKKGGVRYSTKYVLKDLTYDNQNTIIRNYIAFYTHLVSSKYGIIEFPKTADDYFYNRCIRSSKAYKEDIALYVKPYRYMLQFYMCSNDFGVSSIIERYGESLFSLGVLNIDKFPFSIPKAVLQRVERNFGSDKKDSLVKSIFLTRLRDYLETAISRDFIKREYGELLYQFSDKFLQPRFGSLYFVSPFSTSYYDRFSDLKIQIDDVLLDEFKFYEDNDFYELRNEVLSLVNMFSTPLEFEFRAKYAYKKSKEEREQYILKKCNNQYRHEVL